MADADYRTAGDQKGLYHQITLGAILFGFGLRAADAPALEALLALSFKNVAAGAAKLDPELRLHEAIRELIDSQYSVLTARGKARELERRRKAYLAARADWEMNGDTGPNAKWRKRYQTQGQRHLAHMVCQLEKIAMPPGMNRGQTADWLEANFAHHLYLRKDD